MRLFADALAVLAMDREVRGCCVCGIRSSTRTTWSRRSRREAVTAAARERRLDELSTDPERAWQRVADLIATKKPKEYDAAVALLTDLKVGAKRSAGGSTSCVRTIPASRVCWTACAAPACPHRRAEPALRVVCHPVWLLALVKLRPR
jgi:hypothetical protein